MAKARVIIQCTCGSTKFVVPKNPKVSDTIKCTACGETGIYGEVVGIATAAVQQHVEDAAGNAGSK